MGFSQETLDRLLNRLAGQKSSRLTWTREQIREEIVERMLRDYPTLTREEAQKEVDAFW